MDIGTEDVDLPAAHYAVAGYQAVSNSFFAHLALAVAIFVPQLGLLGLLLTSATRVGSFLWIEVFLVISDVLTVYFSLVALIDVWNVRYSERMMHELQFTESLADVSSAPWIVRRFSALYDHTIVDSNISILAVLAGVTSFVLGTSVYIGWLWYNP